VLRDSVGWRRIAVADDCALVERNN
jgi:hypothetical protein